MSISIALRSWPLLLLLLPAMTFFSRYSWGGGGGGSERGEITKKPHSLRVRECACISFGRKVVFGVTKFILINDRRVVAAVTLSAIVLISRASLINDCLVKPNLIL